MVAFLHDNVLDNGLDYLDVANRTGEALHICSGTVTGVRATIITNSLGNKTPPGTTTGVEDHGSSGRQITIDAITDGSVTADGTAAIWAYIDDTNVLACQDLSSSQAVTNGNTFTLDEIIVQIPDPTA